MEEKAKVKKPFYKKWWFFLIVGIVIIMLFLPKNNSSDSTSVSENQEKKVEEPKNYEAVSTSTLIKTLESNALKAKETYKGKYVEISGYLGNIDASGKYITVLPSSDAFVLIGIQAYTTNDDQKKVIAELEKGNKIVVKGKISDVGEVLGYSVDIDEIK